MRRCVFQSLAVLSLKERKARRVEFHPKVTLLRGPNDTGKSALLKSLYHTFGATPALVHPKWKDAEVRSLVRFTIDGRPYATLKNGDHYSTFDSTGKRINKSRSVTRDLSPFLAGLFNFRLKLQSRAEQSQATPAFLFLPFYVDQDVGWTKNWSSFLHLAQFSNWRRDVAEYHMGVRPNDYYEAKSGLLRLREDLRLLHERREILRKVLVDLQAQLSRITFDIDIEVYRAEIEKLLIVCNKLQKREAALKRDLTRLFNDRAVVEAQLAITSAAAKELSSDYRYAVGEVPDEVECPTCGTVHRNDFAERFAIARDESRCRELEAELRTDLARHDEELGRLKDSYSGATAELQEARQLLEQRQGEVTLQQLIENEGKREARTLVEREIAAVNADVGQVDSKIFVLQRRMELYDDPERRTRIRSQYLNRMRRFLARLQVINLPENRYSRLDSSIQETGSDLPRGLLAYYYAVLQTINENDAATVCPIVLDSPRQQDQDDDNWLKIMEFARDEQPSDSQLILSLRESAGVDFGGSVIDLDDKFSVMNESEYPAVFDEVMPLIEQSSRDDDGPSLF